MSKLIVSGNSFNHVDRLVDKDIYGIMLYIDKLSVNSSFYIDVDDIETSQELQFDNKCIQYSLVDANTNYQNIVEMCVKIISDNRLEYRDVVILMKDNEPARELDYIVRQNCQIGTSCTAEKKETFKYLENQHGVNTRKFKIERDHIRGIKRREFSIDSNSLKISTIKSFKGLEQNNVILILPHSMNNHSEVYVGITRARERLFIINMGNRIYDRFFEHYANNTHL
jgi:hypothetical protein